MVCGDEPAGRAENDSLRCRVFGQDRAEGFHIRVDVGDYGDLHDIFSTTPQNAWGIQRAVDGCRRTRSSIKFASTENLHAQFTNS